MYGVSLTSGQPVTIVQKFPDLLQQVVFEVSAQFIVLLITDGIYYHITFYFYYLFFVNLGL